MNREVVVIYGNCQAQFLWQLLSEMPSMNQRFRFLLATDTLEEGEAAAPLAPEIGRAVLLWEQYDQRSELEAREEVRRRVPRDCAVLRYPGIGMHAFWPFRVKDKRGRGDPTYPWGRYPQGDRLALDVARLGLSPERAFEHYMELSYRKMPDPLRLLEWDRAAYARRDAACEVGIGDFVFAALRNTYQFWTHGHVAISVISELLRRLLERSRAVLGAPSEAARAELQALHTVFPGQGEMQVPLHPLVIEQLGLTFADANTRYRWFGNLWTFEEYMKRYLAFDCSW